MERIPMKRSIPVTQAEKRREMVNTLQSKKSAISSVSTMKRRKPFQMPIVSGMLRRIPALQDIREMMQSSFISCFDSARRSVPKARNMPMSLDFRRKKRLAA